MGSTELKLNTKGGRRAKKGSHYLQKILDIMGGRGREYKIGLTVSYTKLQIIDGLNFALNISLNLVTSQSLFLFNVNEVWINFLLSFAFRIFSLWANAFLWHSEQSSTKHSHFDVNKKFSAGSISYQYFKYFWRIRIIGIIPPLT